MGHFVHVCHSQLPQWKSFPVVVFWGHFRQLRSQTPRSKSQPYSKELLHSAAWHSFGWFGFNIKPKEPRLGYRYNSYIYFIYIYWDLWVHMKYVRFRISILLDHVIFVWYGILMILSRYNHFFANKTHRRNPNGLCTGPFQQRTGSPSLLPYDQAALPPLSQTSQTDLLGRIKSFVCPHKRHGLLKL